MAIIYSYPHAVPTINDMVLGAKFKENEGISTNSFYMSDLVTLISAEIPGIPGSEGPQGPAGTTGSQGIQGPQGDQGIQGLAGTVGPAGLEWQGTWESGTPYVADDAVAYDGASWFCILATSGTTPPDADATHWALLAAQGAPGLQGIQGIQGIQGPIGATGTQGIQGVQGLPGAAATQTLQQTVDLGNTISGTQGGINFTTTLTNTSVKVGASTISGMTLNTTQLICEKNNGNDLIALQFPTVYSGIRQITLPATTGTVALTSDITLQKAFDDVARDYAKAQGITDEPKLFPQYPIKKYQPGTFMGAHFDQQEGDERLKVSFVMYLNDDYEGGEISFTIRDPKGPIQGPTPDSDFANADKSAYQFAVKPKAGSIIVFPPSPPYHHTAHLVKSGEKIMVPQHWIH